MVIAKRRMVVTFLDSRLIHAARGARGREMQKRGEKNEEKWGRSEERGNKREKETRKKKERKGKERTERRGEARYYNISKEINLANKNTSKITSNKLTSDIENRNTA